MSDTTNAPAPQPHKEWCASLFVTICGDSERCDCREPVAVVQGHSPLPWRTVNYGDDNDIGILSADNIDCASVVNVWVDSAKSRANAALIVAAVNSYSARHGIDCEKKPHVRTGYLHGEDDDTPYDVDGCKYCGRCHQGL